MKLPTTSSFTRFGACFALFLHVLPVHAQIAFDNVTDSSLFGAMVSSESWGVSFGDYNGDGWADVIANDHRNRAAFYRNNGDGTLSNVLLTVGSSSTNLMNRFQDQHMLGFGDVDGDGDDDIGENRNHFFLYSNNELLEETGSNLYTLNMAQIATDCPNDDFYPLGFDDNQDFNLSFVCHRPATTFTRMSPSIPHMLDLANADFDGDGLLDVIAVKGSYFISDATLVTPTRVEAGFAGFDNSTHSFQFNAQPPLEISVWSRRQAVVTKTLTGSDTAANISFAYSGGVWTVSGTESHIIATAPSGISNLTQVTNLRSSDMPFFPKMYKAAGGGVWQDTGFQNGFNEAVHCAGITAGDFDNDMDMDVYLSCRGGGVNLPNMLYENDGTGSFSLVNNAGGAAGITGGAIGDAAGTSDNAIAGDYNNDGFLDLFLVNGHLDIALRRGGPHQLFKNAGNGNHWLQMKLVGTAPDFDALGAKVIVSAGGVNQVQLQDGGNHRSSQDFQRMHFGLAANTSADIEVTWPNGSTETFNNVTADQIYRIVQNQGISVATSVSVGEVAPPQAGDDCGTPARFAPLDYALFLYKTDCASNTWNVRLSPGSQTDRTFTGVLLGTGGGTVTNVSPSALEIDDSLDWDSSQIEFTFDASDNSEDGFVFTLNGDACLGVYSPDGVQILVGPDYRRIGLSGINPNTLQPCSLDFDGDGILDDVDPDDDNDGVPDVNDDLPRNPNESVDTDGDGIGNNADTDDDGDGVLDVDDSFPLDSTESFDTDGDGIGNNADPDDDGDGVNDATDAFPLDPDESADSDGDGVGDNADQFPNDADEASDFDGDGVGDNGDIDADNDGIPDSVEGAGGGSSFALTTDLATIAGGGASATVDIDLSAQLVGIGQTVTIDSIVADGDLNSPTEFFELDFNDGEQITPQVKTGLRCAGTLTPVTPTISTTVSVIDIGGGVAGVRVKGTTTPSVNFNSDCNDAQYRLNISGDSSLDRDTDGDGAPDYLDLDSDNDAIPDVLEADAADADLNSFIDNPGSDQGSVTSPPDADGDGLADYLDLQSTNPSNDGSGPFDIDSSDYASADTSGDGTLSSLDSNGGTDADEDGIDTLADNLPNEKGTSTGGAGAPAISWADADFSVDEANATVDLTLTVSPAATGGETIRFATAAGSAMQGSDYYGAAPTVSFNAGETSKTVSVSIINDTTIEADETFTVRLFSPSSDATVGTQATAAVTIIDDDSGGGPPVLTTQAMQVNEADGTADIVVTLSPAATSTVTVGYSTVSNSATGGTDFYGTAGNLTFNPGETTKSWSVTLVDNTIDEPSEQFNARLYNANGATIAQPLTPITIVDDDGAGSNPVLSVSDASVVESTGQASVTVSLSIAADVDVTVFTQKGTTQGGGQDYFGFTQLLQFRNGETSKQVDVTIIDDNVPEPTEVIKVRLNNPTGADLADPIGDISIEDDD